jgi:prepilin-type N-terminal cleavage/methylation domain-containing protein
MNKFLKAFTIAELLVVMVLGAIVSALSYQAVVAVSGLYQNFEQRQRQVQQITSWYTMLYKDISNAEKVEHTENMLATVKDEKPTVYTLTSGLLIRQRETTMDSIQLMDGKFAKNLCDSSGLTYCATLTFQYGQQSVGWHFHKRYSTTELVDKLILP